MESTIAAAISPSEALCGAVVVVQHPAQSLTSLDQPTGVGVILVRQDQSISETLVISLAVVQLSNTAPILGIFVKSAIPGIHGMGGQCGCMPLA